MTRITAAFIGLALAVSAGASRAAFLDLQDWAINVDGGPLLVPGDPIPGFIDVSGFDFDAGLGVVTMTITGAGVHYAGLFVDHDIDDGPINSNTFFNEEGSVNGTPSAGQSWEIDEPGFGNGASPEYFGDIFFNLEDGLLDSLVFVNNAPVPGDAPSTTAPDDVSMAMGFDFTLAMDEIATIDFNLSTQMPTGFFLRHFDQDSIDAGDPDANIYFSSALDIADVSVPEPSLPEPATVLLLGAAGLLVLRRRRTR